MLRFTVEETFAVTVFAFHHKDVKLNMRYTFSTGNAMKRDGSEMRNLVSPLVVRSTTLQFLESNYREVRAMEQKLRFAKSFVAVPLWCFYRNLTEDTLGGDGFIYCDTTSSEFQTDQYVLLFRNYDYFDVVKLGSVEPTLMLSTTVVPKSYGVGDFVIPLMIGTISQPPENAYTFNLGQYAVTSFDVTEFFNYDDVPFVFDDDTFSTAFVDPRNTPIFTEDFETFFPLDRVTATLLGTETFEGFLDPIWASVAPTLIATESFETWSSDVNAFWAAKTPTLLATEGFESGW